MNHFKKNIRNTLIQLSSLFLIISLIGCAYNEATGKRQFNYISEEKEIKVGTEADKHIKRQYGIYYAPELQQYVDSIGQKVASTSGRPEIPYHFTILDSPIINAFALPGGYIYVTRGVLAQMNSEAELAFVLGHEISHVTAKHGAQRMSQAQSLGIAMLATSILLQQKNLDEYTRLVNEVVNLAVLGYGRSNEFEADLLGTDYAFSAQYHPKAGSTFLETLKKQEKYHMDWFSTLRSSHPPTQERIEKVDEKIATLPPEASSEKSNLDIKHNEYLSNIEGLYMGEIAQNGTLKNKNKDYYNYYFGFKFKLPNKWKMSGSIEEPVAVIKHRKDVLGTIIVKKIEPKITAKQLANQHKNKGHSLDLSTQVISSSKKNNNSLEKSYYFVNPPFGIILSFTLKNNPDHLVSQTNILAHSFQLLTNEELKSEKAYKLVIHNVKQGETLEKLSLKYFNDSKHMEQIAAFNNIPLALAPKPGKKLKIPIH